MKKIETVQNTIKLLRFPFSAFLLPISLFSFYYIQPKIDYQLGLVLFIWHFLVFPSSNGYNSFHDQDEGPIGGLAAPPKPTKLLWYVSNCFDVLAIVLALFVHIYFSLFVAYYILASRLYSNRKVRLKKLPITGFLVVFFIQGAWVFCANIVGFSAMKLFGNPSVIYSAMAASFFIGTIYPLTQIYQHESDRKDGVKTLSMLLGIRGTFLFSGIMFSIATLLIYASFFHKEIHNFYLFLIVMSPSTIYFLNWAFSSYYNPKNVNFSNTMIMLTLTSLLTNLYFILLLIQ